MKPALHKYQEYKESGFTWLGDIPTHWEIERLKDLSKLIIDGTHYTPDYTDDGVRFLSVNDVTRKPFDLNQSKFISRDAHKELIKRCHPKKGDILLSKNGTIGVPFLIDFEDEVSIYVSLCLIKLLPKISGRYSYYSFLASFMFEQYNLHSKMTSVTNLHLDKLRNFFQLSPPIDEQEAIAHYLDTKTAQIDRKIDLLTQKAQRYEELKRSLINETVTRGLDKSVPMKDSGIEWIGKIPEHWEIKRLKDLGFLYSGLTGKAGSDFTDEHQWSCDFIPFVNIANNQYISLSDMKKVIVAPQEKQNQVKKDDLFFLMSSENYEDIGKTAFLRSDIRSTYLNSFCKGFRFTAKKIAPNFANYLFSSQKYRDSFAIEGKGFTRINLKIEKVNNLFFLLPPLREQVEITEHLDKRTGHIDQIIKNINLQIEIQKELRKTLINDVVTGKIKVIDN